MVLLALTQRLADPDLEDTGEAGCRRKSPAPKKNRFMTGPAPAAVSDRCYFSDKAT